LDYDRSYDRTAFIVLATGIRLSCQSKSIARKWRVSPRSYLTGASHGSVPL